MGRRGIRQPDRPHAAHRLAGPRRGLLPQRLRHDADQRRQPRVAAYGHVRAHARLHLPAGPAQRALHAAVLSRLLRASGYTTAYFGKFGVTYPGAQRLFDAADLYDRRGKFPDRRGYFYKTIDGDTVHLTRYTGYEAQRFLREVDLSKPFCLSLGFSAPHAHDPAPEQYFWEPWADSLYRDLTVAPPLLADDRYFEELPEAVRRGYNRVRWTWRYDTPQKYQHSVKGYYRMISEVDREVGAIRQVLRERGLDRNTIIVFMGDNGYFLGERQLAGKWLMYEKTGRDIII